MFRRVLILAAVLAAAPVPPAGADGIAMLETGRGQRAQAFSIVWRDDGATVRVNTPLRDVSLLLVDGAPYAVRRMNRNFVVLTLSGLGEKAAGLLPGFGSARTRAASVDSLRAVGPKAVVAGIPGKTYEMVWTDTAGARHTDRMVLSDDPLAVEMAAAIAAFETALGHDPGPRAVAVRDLGLGLLRSDEVRLTSASNREPRPGTFTLPAEPQTLDDIVSAIGRMRRGGSP
ncbi:hypothetical protein [uncultured Rhodospira sp.]|uniref:hypothetical protein n=1 Tax=uncultured Rhodospira sp. TaxID=1936189 RepID=UPI002635547E|nr:hypothetical protein [uncultured Rhodospira sp.]